MTTAIFVFPAVYGSFSCMSVLLSTLASLSARQQKSLPALRLSLLSSQQSLTPPPQQGVKPVPGGPPPAIAAGPAVRIHHPNSVSVTTGASALPAGTHGHAAAMVCTARTRWNRLQCRHIVYIYSLYFNWPTVISRVSEIQPIKYILIQYKSSY